MTQDWQPAALPAHIRELVDQWPEGRFEREIIEFREYWIEQGSKRPGWDRTFRSRINEIHDRIMREVRMGQRSWSSSPANTVGSNAEGFLRRYEQHTLKSAEAKE